MRCKFVWLLVGLLILPLVAVSPNAYASSIFDTTVRVTDDATIRCYNYMDGGLLTGDSHSLATNWSALVDPAIATFEGRAVNRSFGSIDPDDVYEAFQDRQSDGKGWGVSVVDDGPGGGNFVRVQVQRNTNPAYFTNIFGSDPDWYSLVSDSTYTLNIHCRNDGFLIEGWDGQAIYARSGSTAMSVYFMKTDISYPSGYEGLVVPSAAPPAKYVAMGDSYSSGEGNPPFEIGTDVGGVSENRCHRSSKAYPRLLQSQLNLGSTAFVACSGATTADVLSNRPGIGNWNEGAQIDTLSEDTEIVTITIGGNDVGFDSYVLGCVTGCGPGSMVYEAMLDGINAAAFEANLETAYESILQNAPNAQVYVMDYPYVSAENASHCGAFDFSGARTVQVAMNSKVAYAVEDVGSSRLHYVDTNASGSPFHGKHYCNGGSTFFNGFDLQNEEYSFHPNTDGQLAYADLIEGAVD